MAAATITTPYISAVGPVKYEENKWLQHRATENVLQFGQHGRTIHMIKGTNPSDVRQHKLEIRVYHRPQEMDNHIAPTVIQHNDIER